MRSNARTRMFPPRRHVHRSLAVGLTAVLATGLLASCSSDDDGEGGGGGDEQITLNVGLFGSIQFEAAELYAEYEELHPNINIEQTSVQENQDYITQLRNRLTQNSGLADIQAIEVGNIAEMAGDLSPRWIDFNEYDVDLSHFQEWKVAQATDPEGRVIGLGYDIGPMAICYRTDLFEEAGLPTDREELAELWDGSWENYLDVGDDFLAGTSSDAAFVDSAGSVFNAVVYGYDERFYNDAGELVYEESQAVQDAWDISVRAANTEGMTARLDQFTQDWDRAFANGDFATIACPAWMLSYIEEKAGPEGAGTWDVAAAPQASNWGGAFVGVPASAEHVDEAVELAAWLTAPEQQVKLFTRTNVFPSSAEAAADSEVVSVTSEYFNGAPTGQIFSDAAGEIPAAVIGPRDQTIQEGLTDGLVQIEQQGVSPDEAWDNTMSQLENALAE
ncbi:ABC transporter substrate-binding protein [Streptomyces sp. 4N509B]|uniref:ABC transporter substrate-binding protein n=1 Tax=Streptomyces sp. 4N509B TaxID=3457413 RepID=UPI003FD19898